jgi:hypothetical protein
MTENDVSSRGLSGLDQSRLDRSRLDQSRFDQSNLDLETPEKPYLDSNELIINMGPQHPATHGVLRVILKLDGEKVLGTECVIGYLHRGVEKIAENRTYAMFNPYVDRMDYVAAVSNGLGYCEAVEKTVECRSAGAREIYSRDPDGTEPHCQPSALAGHARARYWSDDAAVLHLPRPRRDPEDF